MKKILSFVVILLAIFVFAQASYANILTPVPDKNLKGYPKPQGYVSDFANVLSPLFKTQEEKRLSDFTKTNKYNDEIALVTVPTTSDTPIFDYTEGLAEAWKPGVSGRDNGVVILFAMQDHKDWIAIGCGLEGSFTDVQASDILTGDTRTLLRQGKTDQAIKTTVDAVIAQIQNAQPQPCTVGNQNAIKQARDATKNNSASFPAWLVIIGVLVGLIILFVIFALTYSLNDDDNEYNDNDDERDSSSGGFLSGALTGGALGYSVGRSSRHNDDDSSFSSPSSSSGIFGSSSGGEEESSPSFGGFSGGSFSGGGGGGSW